jgi:hypothetical protein
VNLMSVLGDEKFVYQLLWFSFVLNRQMVGFYFLEVLCDGDQHRDQHELNSYKYVSSIN